MSERKVLIAFRTTDITFPVPRNDSSRVCSKCGEGVSLAPSSIKMLSEEEIDIVCNRCIDVTHLVKDHPELLLPRDEMQLKEIIEAKNAQTN